MTQKYLKEYQKLKAEIEEKIASESGYKTTNYIDANIQECINKKCDGDTFKVFQCDTGIWEIWAKCTKCGTIFCLGTE